MTNAYQAQPVDPAVFRAYDIRGIIEESFDENAFYTIGLAISLYLQQHDREKLFLARDGRLSSERLAKALRQGLLDNGMEVIDIGVGPTPLMYFATASDPDIDSGVMVTGSHNPSDYNGIKMVFCGQALTEETIQSLHTLTQSNKQHAIKPTAPYVERDILQSYMQRILADVSMARPLHVVVDAGNGMAGPIAPELFEAMGCKVTRLYCDADGRFPNHHPDPTVAENLTDIKAEVFKQGADLGIAFDGDADRLGVITNRGDIIWPDRIMMLYAKAVLSQNPGGTVVYDVKCSSHLESVIQEAGGKPYMCPTGHSIVKRVMKAEKAVLAGEMSGHLFFNDQWYGFDDAIYSACRLLDILSQSKLSVSEQFDAIPNSVNTPEIKIPIADSQKFEFMSRLREQAIFPNGKVITIDGLRVEFPHGWGLVRASNTTPCLVARFEAEDEASLADVQALFKSQLKVVSDEIEVPF